VVATTATITATITLFQIASAMSGSSGIVAYHSSEKPGNGNEGKRVLANENSTNVASGRYTNPKHRKM
jgi:hypothetical protein